MHQSKVKLLKIVLRILTNKKVLRTDLKSLFSFLVSNEILPLEIMQLSISLHFH